MSSRAWVVCGRQCHNNTVGHCSCGSSRPYLRASAYRFVNDDDASECLLCGQEEDSVEHLSDCCRVYGAYERMCSASGLMDEWHSSFPFLQRPLNGLRLQIVATLFAIGRARGTIAKGTAFHKPGDLLHHLVSLMEHSYNSSPARARISPNKRGEGVEQCRLHQYSTALCCTQRMAQPEDKATPARRSEVVWALLCGSVEC